MGFPSIVPTLLNAFSLIVIFLFPVACCRLVYVLVHEPKHCYERIADILLASIFPAILLLWVLVCSHTDVRIHGTLKYEYNFGWDFAVGSGYGVSSMQLCLYLMAVSSFIWVLSVAYVVVVRNRYEQRR